MAFSLIIQHCYFPFPAGVTRAWLLRVLFQFLSRSKVNQLCMIHTCESCMCTYILSLLITSSPHPHPTHPGHHRAPWAIQQPPTQLSVLHMIMYICISQSPNSSHPPVVVYNLNQVWAQSQVFLIGIPIRPLLSWVSSSKLFQLPMPQLPHLLKWVN